MTDEKFNDKTKAEWEAEKNKQELLILQLEKEKKEEEDKINSEALLVGKKTKEAADAKQEAEDMKALVAGIVSDATANNYLNWAKFANEKYIKFAAGIPVKGLIDEFFESNLGYDGYKWFPWTASLNQICFQMAGIFKDINVKKLFEVIDNTSVASFAGLRADTAKRNELERVLKIYSEDNKMFAYDKHKGVLYNTPHNYSFWSKKIGQIKNKPDWEVILDDDNKPEEVVRYADIFFIMEELFPLSSVNSNVLLDDNANTCLKDKDGNSLLNKSYSMQYIVGNVGTNDGFKNSVVGRKIENLTWGKGGGTTNEGIVKFFWNIFNKNNTKVADQITLMNDNTDLDGQKRRRLKREKEWKVEQYKSVINAIWRKKYVEAVKTYVEGQGKVFSDSLKKAAFYIAEAATKYAPNSISELKKIESEKANIASQMLIDKNDKANEEGALELYRKNLEKDPSKVFGLGSTLVLTKFDAGAHYKALVQNAENDALKKQAIADAFSAPNKEAANAYAVAEIKLIKARAELKKAEDSLKYFEGMDLETLKKEFEKVYGEGTKGGTELGQWTTSQLENMKGILELIKKEESSGQLDSKFAEYKKDLEDNIYAKLIVPDEKIIPLLVSFDKNKTFKEMIESLGFYKNNPSLIEGRIREFREALVDIQKIRKLSSSETFLLEQLEYTAANPGKYKDSPIPQQNGDKIKIGELQEALGAKSTDKENELKLEDWSKVNNFKTKEQIATLMDKTGRKKSNTDEAKKFGAFEEHLNHNEFWSKIEKGAEQWENFIKKGPKFIIGTILYFEYEQSDNTKKDEVKAAMKKAKEDKEKETNVKSVDDSWDENSQKDMTKYLYRKATGKDLFKDVKMKTSDDEGPGKKDKEEDKNQESSWKDWFLFRNGNVWKPILTYTGLLLVVAGIAAAIFWKSIMNWWNGPAEEAGAMGDEDENKDEESE